MPDLVQAIIGFRRWKLEDDLLRSSGAGEAIWDPGVTVAECETGMDKAGGVYLMVGTEGLPQHDAPSPDCGCGLYAHHEPRLGSGCGGEVLGAIAAWGKIEVHATGFRAERARVVALALDDRCLVDQGRRKAIVAAAATYGAAVVPSYLLAEEAYRHGIEVPEGMRPAKLREGRLFGSSYHPGGSVGARQTFAVEMMFSAEEINKAFKRISEAMPPWSKQRITTAAADTRPSAVARAQAKKGAPRDPHLQKRQRKFGSC